MRKRGMLDPTKTTAKICRSLYLLPLGGEVLILGSTHKQSKFIAGNSTKRMQERRIMLDKQI
jgi:hypothetical protein